MVPDVYNGKTKIGKPNCKAKQIHLLKCFKKREIFKQLCRHLISRTLKSAISMEFNFAVKFAKFSI